MVLLSGYGRWRNGSIQLMTTYRHWRSAFGRKSNVQDLDWTILSELGNFPHP